MPFKGNFDIRKISAYEYMVLEEYSYTTPEGETCTVPAGFVTDGASIPRIAWFIVGSPFTGLYTEAAVLHDRLYITQSVNRKKADKIFLQGMEDKGVSWWKRRLMWRMVRIFSWMPWNRYKSLKKKLMISIVLIAFCLSNISCASLKASYDEKGRIEEVWSTGIQDTEITQEKDGVKTTIKRKAAFQLWPENLFNIYKD